MKYYLLFLFCIPLLWYSNSYSIGKSSNNFQIFENPYNEKESVISHEQWSILLSKYVTKEGTVNYDGFKKDEKALEAYLTILKNNAPSNSWSKTEILAYWINAYNAFTIQLILNNYPVKSIKDINDPWGVEFIDIGDNNYSLSDIEHEILRKMNEPRIHFAINCASYSCPNLLNQAYTAEHLDAQLEEASSRFINDPAKNTLSEDTIEISKIFEWFAEDFEKQGTLIDFLNKYSVIKIETSASVMYKDYNWSLND